MDPPPPPANNAAVFANHLVIVFNPTTPGIYRSLRRYVATCAHVGCSLPSATGSGFCCLGHQDLAASYSQSPASFHYVGGFLSKEDQMLNCCVALLNRNRGFNVGIPVLDQTQFFDVFPWELPDVFNTEMGKCNWLFFKKPPSEYKQIRQTRMKWKLNKRYQLYISGIAHPEIFLTGFSLTRQPGLALEEIDINLAHQWTLKLYEGMGFSLYCLSSKGGQVEIDPQVDKIQRNKSLPPTPKPTASLKPAPLKLASPSKKNKREPSATTLLISQCWRFGERILPVQKNVKIFGLRRSSLFSGNGKMMRLNKRQQFFSVL